MGSSTATFLSLLIASCVLSKSPLEAQTWERCDTLFTLEGEAPGDQFGWIVASGRDIDGDGIHDPLVGAPFHDAAAPNAGRGYAFSGATGALLFTFDGSSAGENAGQSIAWAGDVDGDGHADIMVGGPGGAGLGRAYLYSGADGSLVRSWSAAAPGDQFGWAVGGGGDLSGDGVPDQLVGAPGYDGIATNAGRVHAYSGADGSLLWTWDGESEGASLGHAVGFVGDRDGDGRDEVVAGAPGGGPQGAGRAHVYSGADGSRVFLFEAPTPTAVIFGAWFTDFAGDVDSDGVRDIIVADCQDAALGANTGSVSVYSGASGALLYTIFGESAGDGHCAGPGWFGDYDGDGVDDLVFGSWRASHATVSLGGKIRIHSGVDGRELGRFSGSVAGDQLGYDSAAIADLDGDGVSEVLGSCAPHDQFRGIVHVLSGRPLLPSSECTTAPNSAGEGARMRYRRSWSVSANELRLRVEGGPPGEVGVFFHARTAANLPFGEGTLCLAAPRYRSTAPVTLSAGGTRQEPIDLDALTGPGAITAGSTWLFQFWYRDPAGGGSGVNLSDALRGTFCP